MYQFYFFLTSSRKYLIQALSEEDRKSWLEIMEGKEPVYTSLKVIERKDSYQQLHGRIRAVDYDSQCLRMCILYVH